MEKERLKLQKYFKTFFEEKNLDFQEWELKDTNGNLHLINSDIIQEFLTTSEIISTQDLKSIKAKIFKIDFKNGNINLFLKYLAQIIVNNF